MPLHPERERLEALEEQEGVERAQGRAEVPEHLHPALGDVGGWTEGLRVAYAVVAGVWIHQLRELAVCPVESPESTITPPMEVPWPPMNLVAE